MSYKTVTVDVDVYVDDVLNEMSDEDFIEVLKERGYCVTKEHSDEFDREDWFYLIEMIDKIPETWYTRRVREKLLRACYG